MKNKENKNSKIGKKLYRLEEGKMVFGVLAGLGEYFDLDPTLLRLGFVVLLFLTGVVPFVILYLIAAVIVPVRPAQV